MTAHIHFLHRAAAIAPAPRILPDDMDKLLEQRWQADDMFHRSMYETDHSYEIVRLQGDYARRLDAIAAQRGQE